MLKEEIGKIAVKLRKLVECPVCLLTPREGPVPCCPNGHLVCATCLEKWRGEGRRDCPTCRGAMGQGKSRLAFAVAEQVQHECRHHGCKTMLPLDQIEDHERGCDWRLIVCPSWPTCRARIPLCRVEIHAQVCGRCRWPPLRMSKNFLLRHNAILPKSLLDNNITDVKLCALAVQFEGFLFFVRVFKKVDGGNFNLGLAVAMKGSQEECQGFMIEAAIFVDANEDNFKVAFGATFPPRPLEKVDGFFGLFVPHEVLIRVGEYNAEREEYTFSYGVKIVKLG